MKSVVLYLHVHQPHRVRPYSIFETSRDHNYFDSSEVRFSNEEILHKVAMKSYLPTNKLLRQLLEENAGFRVSMSITGTFIEQCERWAPEVLRSFQELVATGKVDIVAETYQHSLAFFYSRFEFEKQVLMHREKIETVFGVTPQVFRNTELSYNDMLGEWAESAGYKAVLAEGWDPVLEWRSPNFVYQAAHTASTKLLLKNYRLSDDIAFRFSNKDWAQWPLTVDTYMDWLPKDDSQVVNLFMDYETFGEHQWESTGIFDFLKHFVEQVERSDQYDFKTVSEAADLPAAGVVSMPQTVTWADTERDLTAWLGNRMQQEAMRLLYEMEDSVLGTHDDEIIRDWRALQTSDHVYYMCTKWFNDGDVHAYFSPYESPYDAFIYFMNVVRDLRWRVMEHQRSVA